MRESMTLTKAENTEEATLASIRRASADLGQKGILYKNNPTPQNRLPVISRVQLMIPYVYSNSPNIGRETAYALVSNSAKLNLGLDPTKNTVDLSDEENEIFYNGVVEFIKASEVYCVSAFNARATDQYTDGDRVVELALDVRRVLPFTINGKRIVLNSDEVPKGDLEIVCSTKSRKLSQDFTAAGANDDRMFSAKATFAIPEDLLEKQIVAVALTSRIHIQEPLTLKR